ncbi:MAG: hypothetical protein HOP29_03640 [Phycisphaerales bacterium]|nr:hypothetical protein [Phycisphaerales bacterium]
MHRGRRQWVLVGVPGVVLVGVAVYRLQDGGTPPVSEAASIDAPFGSTVSYETIRSPHMDKAWRLPMPEEFVEARSGVYARPLNDPFVLSDRIRRAVQGASGAAKDDRSSPIAPPVIEGPPPAVRSCFETGGEWFAEIGGRIHRVGDTVIGFRITRIDRNAVAFIPTGAGDASSSAGDDPACLLRVGPMTLRLVGGRWVAPGDSQSAFTSPVGLNESLGATAPYVIDPGTGIVEVRVGEGYE